ncbi:MAG TPA: glycoside hydrolase family 172 protein [Chryseosolibacter sp.]|nr:glycoside hydrolase family 172 protein [Chryseosolibacter sp.]
MKTLTILILLGLFSITAFAQLPATDLYSVSQIRKGIKSKRVSSYDTTGGNNDRFENIKTGEKRVIFDVAGAGVINHIWITIAPDPAELKRDDIVLRMYWDGNTFPSVESPIGSFFGQGWNEWYNFQSQPLIAGPQDAKALVSYFAMPFAKGARIEIENQGERTIDAFYYYVDYYEMEKLPPDAGRFHAWYNQELTTVDGEAQENEWGVFGGQKKNPDGKLNYVFADVKGKGQFVGVNYYIQCPTPIWYGEGDDMIFIDGAPVATLHGTGTEDYFNTSWCPKEPFQHAYFGYPRVNTSDRSFSGSWMGRTHVYRFHIADPIYFDNSLKFTIEHGHNNVLVLDLRSVAYWYLSQPAAVPAIRPKTEREVRHLINPVDIHRWRDAWRKAKGNDPKLWGNEQ